MKYCSLLICFHEGHTDIFMSGQPIGVIRDGVFQLHQIVTPSGNLRDTTIRDLKNVVVNECPFDSLEELRDKVVMAANAMAPEKVHGL